MERIKKIGKKTKEGGKRVRREGAKIIFVFNGRLTRHHKLKHVSSIHCTKQLTNNWTWASILLEGLRHIYIFIHRHLREEEKNDGKEVVLPLFTQIEGN